MKEQIEKLIEEKTADFNKSLRTLLNGMGSLAAEKETKPVVGKWYKSYNCLFNYQGEGKYGMQGYGFCADGDWRSYDPKTDRHWGRFNNDAPATPEEIKTALVKEAEKRGFKQGAKVNRPNELLAASGSCLENVVVMTPEKPSYCEKLDAFWFGGWQIYCKGFWAEIISEPVITIGSYKAEYSLGPKSFVKFGCKKFQYGDVCSLLGYMKTMDIECVAVEGYTVSRDKIEEIKKGFNP